MTRKARSPPSKRVKLETSSPSSTSNVLLESNGKDTEDPEYQCSICLQDIVDRTVIPTCFHEFCFECITLWAEQSRRCPLCSQSLEDYLIHNIRSKSDFRRYHLPPLRKSPVPERNVESRRRQRTARERERERRLREEREASDRLAQSIARRQWIYRHHLYAKHVASNAYTRYRPYPTPTQFAASNDLITRTTIFLRREFQVWDNIDVEFLTTFTISLMKSIDIRSESAVKLLAEFLDIDAPYMEGGRHVNAEHFVHEVYSFVRSPFRDLFVYDSVVQYDMVDEGPPQERGRRWRSVRHSRSRPRDRSFYDARHSRDRSVSCSPSDKRYSPHDVRISREFLTDRNISSPRRNQSNRRESEQIVRVIHSRENSNEPRDTSGRLKNSVKGKEREHPVQETAENCVDVVQGIHFEADLLGAETASVAQLSAPPPRPPTIRPGHRSIIQSVQKHLKRDFDNQPGGLKGTRPERHHDAPDSDYQSSSSTLLTRLSNPLRSAHGTESGPRLEILTSSPDDHPHTTQPTYMSSSNTMSHTSTAHVVVNSHTTVTNSSPARPRDIASHPTPSSAPMPKIDPAEPPLPLVTSLVSGNATTISQTSYDTKGTHQEAISDISHMGISLRGNSIDDLTHHSMSTVTSHDDLNPSTSVRSRKNLLARLEREKLYTCNQRIVPMTSADILEPADEASFTLSSVDPDMIEKKLRKRAQLQMRLAAEKSSTGL